MFFLTIATTYLIALKINNSISGIYRDVHKIRADELSVRSVAASVLCCMIDNLSFACEF